MSRFLIKKQNRNRGSAMAEPSGINSEKIIVALDTSNLDRAKKLVNELIFGVKFFKIGLEVINTGFAPELVQYIKRKKGKVFYDIKLNDIPNTVAKAMKIISKLRVDMVSVHASVGAESLRAAVRSKGKSRVVGVTVLTTISSPECKSIFGVNSDKKVIQFADMLVREKCDGVICSSREARLLRKFKKFDSLKIITPGVRPTWSDKNEQKRITTPRKAIEAGADYLVIGRPITNPPVGMSRKEALNLILDEINKR